MLYKYAGYLALCSAELSNQNGTITVEYLGLENLRKMIFSDLLAFCKKSKNLYAVGFEFRPVGKIFVAKLDNAV